MNKSIDFYHCAAGVITAIVVAGVSGYILWENAQFWEAMAWQALILPCLFVISGPTIDKAKSRLNTACLWVSLVLIFALSWRVPVDIFFIYTIVWIACAVFALSKPQCWLWFGIINVAWYFIRVYSWSESSPLLETLLVSTFHAFAVFSSLTSKEASEANRRTQNLMRELQATQHLLGEASRESERTRIARDLHDLLGHHLTALTINLQVAGHHVDGEAKEKVDQCYALSKLLLNDVRDAVSALREMPVVDVRELLEIAVRDIPRLSIELNVQDGLSLDDVNTAEVLLRFAQEAITNTLKHTSAVKAKIKVAAVDKNLLFEYGDGAELIRPPVPGNGLNGMRERLERIGGELVIKTKPHLVLQGSAPLAA